jgi:cellulose synthase/poly-beta-1,6-N-acetylglucosamine synthase-like glycosyltransferase
MLAAFVIWFSFAALIIYGTAILLFFLGLFFPQTNSNPQKPFVSVVIALKNERERIPELLQSLLNQNYPDELYEIIMVDNESTDGSGALLRQATETHPKLQVFSTTNYQTPLRFKKAALQLGIEQACGEIILMTDADCLPGSGWIRSMACSFRPGVGMVVSFTGIRDTKATFNGWQALDYLMLMAGAQGSLNLGLVWGCAGSNMAFRKSVFEAVGGYQALVQRIGGDDSLFMQIIHRKTGQKVSFAAVREAWVETASIPSLKEFLQQRMRWAADANYMLKLNPLFFVVILATFLSNLAPFGLGLAWWNGLLGYGPLLGFLLVKLSLEGLLTWRGTAVYYRKQLQVFFPVWFLLQMPYIVLMGVLSFFGNRTRWQSSQST